MSAIAAAIEVRAGFRRNLRALLDESLTTLALRLTLLLLLLHGGQTWQPKRPAT